MQFCLCGLKGYKVLPWEVLLTYNTRWQYDHINLFSIGSHHEFLSAPSTLSFACCFQHDKRVKNSEFILSEYCMMLFIHSLGRQIKCVIIEDAYAMHHKSKCHCLHELSLKNRTIFNNL